jgi:hypothetical protein
MKSFTRKHKAPVAAIFVLSCSASVAASLKVVNVDLSTTLDAVRIIGVAVAGNPVEVGQAGVREDRPGKPFQADDNWLKNMTISIRNRTDKTIVSGEVMVWFPETLGNSPERPEATTMYRLRFGQRPDVARYYKDGSKIPPDTFKPVELAPGQTMVIPLADHIDAIQSLVEGVGNTPFSHITKINLQRGSFYFVDGMRWENFSYFAPDLEHPGKYTALAQDFFPGRTGGSDLE